MRHHHHSIGPVVAAGLVGAAAALVAYLQGRKDSLKITHMLHDELHQQVERNDVRAAQMSEVMGRNFMGAAAGQQHLAEAFNSFVDEFREFRAMLVPPRAQPGGEEPAG